MKLENTRLAQVMIAVDRFDQGVAFCRDVLGLPSLFSDPPQMAFFNGGGVRLLVGVLASSEVPQRGSAVDFQVHDIGAVFATLKDAGVQFKAEPHWVHRTPISELWLAEFVDPDGNQLAQMSEVTTGPTQSQTGSQSLGLKSVAVSCRSIHRSGSPLRVAAALTLL